MNGWLLDTNILSDLVRNPQGRVGAKIAQIGESRIFTSIIVASELRYGAAKRQSERLNRQLGAILAAIDILPLEETADHHYAAIRQRLEAKGTPIGANDLLIAAHALSVGQTLVTANVREFSRIEELETENWLD